MKPCPHCLNASPVPEEIDVDVWAVVCNTCNTIGPHDSSGQTEARAIERWDERPESSPVPQMPAWAKEYAKS